MSPLVIIFVTVFIDLLGFGIIIPLLPFYAETFGASALVVGLLSTSFSLMQFLFAPIWGRLSDIFGRRPIILAGLLGSAVSYLAFGLAASLPMLFAARILAGIAGANIPTAQAFIADSTTPENRAKGMGLVGAAFGLGFIFGPAIGGFLSHWGYSAPAFFAATLSLANFSAALFFLPESLPPEKRGASRAAGPGRGLPARVVATEAGPGAGRVLPGDDGLCVVRVDVRALRRVALRVWRDDHRIPLRLGRRRPGTVQGVIVGRVVPRVGEHRLVPAAILVMVFALAGVATAPSVAMLMAAMGLLAMGMGFNSPSMLSVVSRLADPADQGSTLGVSQSLASLARIVGPLWGGFVFDRFGHSTPFYTASALMLVACGLSVLVFRGFELRPATVR